MINGMQPLSGSKTATYCAKAVHHFYSGPLLDASKEASDSDKFGPYCTEEQRKMYDAYLLKLDPKSQLSKTIARQQTRSTAVDTAQKSAVVKLPTTEEEKQRIKNRYAEKGKERQLRVYEQAVLIAEEREKEDGRRFRSQRIIKFHVNYGTYFGQRVYVVGSSAALGGWNPAKALPLTWEPGNTWSGASVLSTDDGVVEYKYILIDSNTGSTLWEPGFNHKINTKEINSNAILIEDQWGSGTI